MRCRHHAGHEGINQDRKGAWQTARDVAGIGYGKHIVAGSSRGVNGFGADLMTFATALVAARRILSKFMGVFLEEAGLMADAGFRTR